MRREFQNTAVKGVDADSQLGRKLAGIGFVV